MTEVKKGGKVEYTCEKCHEPIPPKTAHIRAGGKPFKRYHTTCALTDPKTE